MDAAFQRRAKTSDLAIGGRLAVSRRQARRRTRAITGRQSVAGYRGQSSRGRGPQASRSARSDGRSEGLDEQPGHHGLCAVGRLAEGARFR